MKINLVCTTVPESPTSKKVLALVISAKKLNLCFQTYIITVIASLVCNSLKLNEFNIVFKPHPTIKTQAIVDFLTKCTSDSIDEGIIMARLRQQLLKKKNKHGKFVLMAIPIHIK